MKGPIQLSGEKITIEIRIPISILTFIKELLASSSGVALENKNSPVSETAFRPLFFV